ncbi:ATPase [Sphingobium sp. SCG-1]|uniref:SRPBCC domain-containing protein n=1 Tax=Sphingobium sp. SCG-1 TaxID=2072936 RepID=UPI000CD6ABFF|nr:SRPBCC domain-containing protein [Sphingobium sp. SCG-1]AUW59390.1 ATPase [Sphingobium sp. SCG-1]
MNDDTRELKVEKHIAAPTAKVWEIMTERLTEWWCPKPWTTEIVEMDRRPGGRAAMVMHGPNGEAHPSDGIYLAYEPGVRFAFTDALNADLTPQTPFMIGIFSIAADGDGTLYTACARHWTDEAMQQHKDMGFEQGWGAVADQLKALCEAD